MSSDRRSDPVQVARRLAAALLVIGWVAAGAAWLTAVPPDENPDVDDMVHSRKYVREVERLGGKGTLLVIRLEDWLASQWEGTRRARTIALLSTAAAGAVILLRRAGWPAPGKADGPDARAGEGDRRP